MDDVMLQRKIVVTGPAPLARRAHQSLPHRIQVQIIEPRSVFLLMPHKAVAELMLPYRVPPCEKPTVRTTLTVATRFGIAET